ncbi:MAG TPA: ribosome biogenesis GTPase Der [Bacteroidetes bacterium]|nr:ribosome biogenesis GTPase Der [Bacteroidota bacterium]HBW00294.1 ribosome biogenesis GTPase Der [Bacteroidota bacterium]
MRPVVAIVGRPNVGKSTFFNRMIGEREAIVHDEYGVTRDRHYGVCDWNGRTFTVIDTGGFLPDKDDEIATAVREQIQLGIQEAHVVLFLVDSVMGIQQLDDEVAKILRKSQKPVIVVSNKADNEERMLQANEFYGLGFGDLFAVSSISGLGTGDLLDRVVELLPPIDEEEEGDRLPRISFIGRPNVGKSSLVNALLKTDRCIVTDIPGTTRDSIDTQFSYEGEEYILVDTAGLRKKARVKENIEFYSTVRTEKAIRECDVAVLLIDATRGFEDQDKKVLNLAERFNKGMLIAVNKWDLIEDKETNTWKAFEQSIKQAMPQIDYVPCFSLSALTGQRVDKLMGHVIEVLEERKKQIPTKKFTEFISDVTKMRPLPMKRGRTLTIQYASQVKSNPPVFKFFMNQPQDLPANYRKFIVHQIREEYGFEGVPITMVFRQK